MTDQCTTKLIGDETSVFGRTAVPGVFGGLVMAGRSGLAALGVAVPSFGATSDVRHLLALHDFKKCGDAEGLP